MASTLTRTPSATPSDISTSSTRTLSRLPPVPRNHSVGPSAPSSVTVDPRRRPLPPPPPSPARVAPAVPSARAMAPPRQPSIPDASPSGFASFASGSGSGAGAAGSGGTGGNAFTTAASTTGAVPAFAAPSLVRAYPFPTPSASAPRGSPHSVSPAFADAGMGSSSSHQPRSPPAISPALADAGTGPSSSHHSRSPRLEAAPPRRGNNVIDLTSSSPPPSSSRRLVPAAERSGLAFPGSAAGPSNVGASTSAAGPSRSTLPRGCAADELHLSDGDTDSDLEYADIPRGGGGASTNRWAGSLRFGGGSRVASGAPAAGPSTGAARDAPLELSDDSDVEIVSERPPTEPLPPRLQIASPPPFVVPPGSTSTSFGAGPSSNLRSRQSNRFGASSSSTTAAGREDTTASDAALARRLAAAEAAAARRNHRDYSSDYQDSEEDARWAADYVATQQARANAAGGRGASAPRRSGGFGGIFSRTSGSGGNLGWFDQLAASIPQGMYAYYDGGFWPGGAAGGLAGLFGTPGGGGPYAGPAGATGGWGGAAKVKAASKKYGVTMSHGKGGVEKGFTRDIVEPLEEGAAPPPAKKAKTSGKGKGKAVDPDIVVEEQVPVCASCLDPLFLGGEGARKVFALKCGHVVCAKCLDEAKGRCRAAKGTADILLGGGGGGAAGGGKKGKGKKAVKVVEAGPAKKGRSSRKGKSVTFSDDVLDIGNLTPSELDALVGGAGALSSEIDFDAPLSSDEEPLSRSSRRPTAKGPSAKAKGKARSRSDETGVEEDWTICPVATCDGKGGDVLAKDGWARPYELFV